LKAKGVLCKWDTFLIRYKVLLCLVSRTGLCYNANALVILTGQISHAWTLVRVVLKGDCHRGSKGMIVQTHLME
jgi:hypothetical protein